MTDIEAVRALTGNNEISDAFIAFYLEAAGDFIKSYCNVDSIPSGLKTTYIEIAALKVTANTSGANASLGVGIKTIGSISDGNQSIGYALGGAGSKTFVSNEDFIAAYGDILGRYRRMVVDRPFTHRGVGARNVGAVKPPKSRCRW